MWPGLAKLANIISSSYGTVVSILICTLILCLYLWLKDVFRDFWSMEKPVVVKSKCSALNDHVAKYFKLYTTRRLLPEVTVDLLYNALAGGSPIVKEIRVMGDFVRLREFLPYDDEQATTPNGHRPSASNIVADSRSSQLIVVAIVAPSNYVTFRELYLYYVCAKMSHLKLFTVFFDDRTFERTSFSTKQIKAAVDYLSGRFPKCHFAAMSSEHEADVLLNYLGDTGAACKFESAVLLAPNCQFGQRRKSTRHDDDEEECKSRSGAKLRKISLQNVSVMTNCDQVAINDFEMSINIPRFDMTPKTSATNVLSAFLPDNVDDVAIPVLWIPEQRAEGTTIAPLELFEESINFMLLHLDSATRCRMDLWQSAVQFGVAVHSFFHAQSTRHCNAVSSDAVRRK